MPVLQKSRVRKSNVRLSSIEYFPFRWVRFGSIAELNRTQSMNWVRLSSIEFDWSFVRLGSICYAGMLKLKYTAKINVCCELYLFHELNKEHFVFFRAQEIFWMNKKTIIEFGLSMIWRIMQISAGVIRLLRRITPFKADKTPSLICLIPHIILKCERCWMEMLPPFALDLKIKARDLSAQRAFTFSSFRNQEHTTNMTSDPLIKGVCSQLT